MPVMRKEKPMFMIIFAVFLVVGERGGAWTTVHALFALVLYYGFDLIAAAIRTRTITVNWTGPIRVKHIYGEEDSHD
jgi:hypothetical protein